MPIDVDDAVRNMRLIDECYVAAGLQPAPDAGVGPEGRRRRRQVSPAPAGLREVLRQAFCGKPRLRPPWLGSSHRLVMTLPRVKKCTPSAPCACASPKRLFFQPPKE